MNKTMRTMVIALVAMFTLAANAQVVTKDSLSVLKPGSVIGFVCDFSEAVIMGMDEEAFGKYERDWQADKPTVVANLMNGLNTKLDGVLVFAQLKDLDYTLKISVKSVSTMGNIYCDAAIVDKKGNKIFEVTKVNGGKEPRFSPGTKLAKMKVWAGLTGRSLGGIIRAEYLNQ